MDVRHESKREIDVGLRVSIGPHGVFAPVQVLGRKVYGGTRVGDCERQARKPSGQHLHYPSALTVTPEADAGSLHH
jgi:hypothetical protein